MGPCEPYLLGRNHYQPQAGLRQVLLRIALSAGFQMPPKLDYQGLRKFRMPLYWVYSTAGRRMSTTLIHLRIPRGIASLAACKSMCLVTLTVLGKFPVMKWYSSERYATGCR